MPIHGQYSVRSKSDVDNPCSYQWLRNTGLKSETEGVILVTHIYFLLTGNYQIHILKK